MSSRTPAKRRALYLMRHGEVEEDYHHTFGGKIDMNLSSRGVSQAEALAEYLQEHPFDSAFMSPMKRVRQTAQPHIERSQATPAPIDGLKEVDFGDWTGLKWAEIQEKHNQSAFDWLHLLEANQMQNAEPIETFRGRVAAAMESVLQPDSGQQIGVFCHGGVIRMILALILDIPVRQMSAFEFDYASVTVVHFKGSRPEIQLTNFCPWRHPRS